MHHDTCGGLFDNIDRITKPSRNGFLVDQDLTKLYFSIPKGERELIGFNIPK